MFAAELGHPEVVAWLLEFKASANDADVNGTTPLHLAAKGGHVEVGGCAEAERLTFGQCCVPLLKLLCV
jgi:ankyrin repeat protein